MSRADYEPRAVERVQRVLGNRSFQRDRRRLSAEDLLREVNPREREILQTLAPGRRQELQGGAYLLRNVGVGLDRQNEHRREYLRVAAEMFEDLAGQAGEQRDRRAIFQALSQAATCWSLAGYQANALVLGTRLREAFPEFDLPGAPIAPAGAIGAPGSLDFYAVAAGVIERDLGRLERLVELRGEFLDDVQAALLDDRDGEPDLGVAELIEMVALGELLNGVGEALEFWRVGNERAAERAEARLAEAEKFILASESPESWLVVNSAREVFADSIRASTWRTLRRHVSEWSPLWTRYVRQLAAQARPIVELWPSQRMALEAGLLDPARNALVVRTPTSSGKTRMAEAAIVDAISAGTLDTCCVYIVPFRALATEVEAGLGATLGDLGIRVSSLFGGYETSELENHLLSNSNVLILTPEKLDLVLRADPTFAVRLKLIVVDEGQLLGDENARAIRLELLLTRLRRAAPDARVLFLSAVVPNVDQVARWLAPGAQEPLDQSWRPTRLLTGVFRWSDDRGRIDYEGQTDYFVPYVLMRQIRSLGLTPVRREPTKPKPWPKSVAETAAELALHFQRIGPVAVFAAQPRNCAAVCKALVTGLRLRVEDGGAADVIGPDGQAEIDELVTLAAKHLGSQHELVGWLRLGIAYHHARVPEALRVRIEDAFRSGALQILVCTTTLSQGVNLPVKTLIVSHTLRDKDEYVSVRDFWNIAGRAGRANHETRGQVILVESPTGSEAQRQRGYLDHRNIEPLTSRLLDLLAWLAQQRCPTAAIDVLPDVASMNDDDVISADLGELVDDDDVIALEGQILALLCEEVVDSDDLEDAEALLGSSLAGVQLADLDAPTKPFARFLAARARAAAEAVPDTERRLRFYRTGLSVDSCIGLEALADALVEEFGERLWADEAEAAIRERILLGALSVAETRPAEDVPAELAVEIAGDWIAYGSIEELRARYAAKAPQLDDPTTLNLFIQSTFANGMPWSLSALLGLLDDRIPSGQVVAEGLRALPALVKFGVDSPQAAYASTLVAQDRETARKLAELASRSGVAPGFDPFHRWLSELRIEDLRQTLGSDPETERLARRVARLSTSNVALELILGQSEVVVSVRGLAHGDRTENARQLAEGDRVQLERERDNPHDVNAVRVRLIDGSDLGYVARDAARGLAGRLDDDPDAFVVTVREVDADVPAVRLDLRVE